MTKRASRSATAEPRRTAPESQPATQRPPLTFDATLGIRTPSDPQITADGTHVAFTLAEWPQDQSTPRQRIWLVETDGDGEPRPFTNGPKSDSSPVWSPDGRWLAFVSERGEADKGHAQLYVQSAEGGDARRICLMPNGAASPQWSPDGSRIAFLSHEGAEYTSGPKVNEELRHTRLWTVRPESDTAEPVTPPDRTVWRYAWSPDSARFAVFYSTGPSETDWYRGQLGLVPAHGGVIRQITHLTRQAEAPTWSRDGRTLYFILGEWSDSAASSAATSIALPIDAGEIDEIAKSGKNGKLAEPRNLTPGIERSISWLHEREDGRLLYAAWDYLANSVGLLDPATGTTTPLTTDFLDRQRRLAAPLHHAGRHSLRHRPLRRQPSRRSLARPAQPEKRQEWQLGQRHYLAPTHADESPRRGNAHPRPQQAHRLRGCRRLAHRRLLHTTAG